MNRSNRSVPTKDGDIQIRCFSPDQPGPLLIVLPSIFGISPDVVTFSERFALQGALVYAIDPFWRHAPGPLPIPDGAVAAMERMHQSQFDDVYHDLLTVIDIGLQDEDCTGELLLLGICFGGQFVVKATHDRKVNAVATWHGAGILPHLDPLAMKNTRYSFDFGADDPLIPLSEVEIIRSKMKEGTGRIGIHPHAGHGFTHLGTTKCIDAAAQAAEAGVIELISIIRSRSTRQTP